MNMYEIVTERIISALKEGKIPWRQRFSIDQGLPRNAITGRPYRGVNLLLLWLAKYQDNRFLTFKQAMEQGGTVRKGSHGWPVIFWKLKESDEINPTTGEPKKYPVLKHFTLFNLSQTQGLSLPKIIEVREFTPIEMAERVVGGYHNPPRIVHGKGRGGYCVSRDIVEMPHPETFTQPEHYYAVLFHELTHSTGHPERLNRKEIAEPSKFGGESYSCEELVAEVGAAFLCAECGIDRETLSDQAAYVQNWLVRLKKDPRMVVVAAAAAQRAADYILGRTVEPVETQTKTAADPVLA